MQPATSHDVARMAGVSQSTVSRALRGEPGMSSQTRDKVRRAADALGYVPSERGRSLSTRVTGRVGIMSAELTNPFYPELVEPLRRELGRHGYRVVLIADDIDSPASISALADGSVDGLILATAELGSSMPMQLRDRGIPVVLVNRELDGSGLDACVMNNVQGAAEVARLFAELGHRRVAAVLGPDATSTSRDRERGFRDGLADLGIALPASRIRRGPFSHESGHAATIGLLDQPEPPTAIFYANDVLAIGGLNAARARGVAVGSELTVVGYDDISMARWELFALTTVRCALADLAREAVDMLVDRLGDNSRDARRVVLDPELVLRSTHGPAPAGTSR